MVSFLVKQSSPPETVELLAPEPEVFYQPGAPVTPRLDVFSRQVRRDGVTFVAFWGMSQEVPLESYSAIGPTGEWTKFELPPPAEAPAAEGPPPSTIPHPFDLVTLVPQTGGAVALGTNYLGTEPKLRFLDLASRKATFLQPAQVGAPVIGPSVTRETYAIAYLEGTKSLHLGRRHVEGDQEVIDGTDVTLEVPDQLGAPHYVAETSPGVFEVIINGSQGGIVWQRSDGMRAEQPPRLASARFYRLCSRLGGGSTSNRNDPETLRSVQLTWQVHASRDAGEPQLPVPWASVQRRVVTEKPQYRDPQSAPETFR